MTGAIMFQSLMMKDGRRSITKEEFDVQDKAAKIMINRLKYLVKKRRRPSSQDI
jgi:hypothetical protein